MALVLRQTRSNDIAQITWEELADMTDSAITEDTYATLSIIGNIRNETYRVVAQKAVEVWIP